MYRQHAGHTAQFSCLTVRKHLYSDPRRGPCSAQPPRRWSPPQRSHPLPTHHLGGLTAHSIVRDWRLHCPDYRKYMR